MSGIIPITPPALPFSPSIIPRTKQLLTPSTSFDICPTIPPTFSKPLALTNTLQPEIIPAV